MGDTSSVGFSIGGASAQAWCAVSAPGSRVESTRERILAILRRHGEAGVNELALEIELAAATVRRHLDVLLRDGHVGVAQQRGRTGRPRYVFSLTEAGAELFPHHYVRLTHRLVDEIMSLDARETEGRDGRALTQLVFDRMSERLVREYAPRIREGSLESRARRVTELLAEEGLDFEVTAGANGEVRLLGRGCPCGRLRQQQLEAAGREDACTHDRSLLSRLLGCELEPLDPDEVGGSMVSGARLSGFLALAPVEALPAASV